MVKGIEKFKKFFEGFEDCYVVIGGTACEIHEPVLGTGESRRI